MKKDSKRKDSKRAGIDRVLQRKEDSNDVKGHQGKMHWTSKGNWSKKMNRPQGDY